MTSDRPKRKEPPLSVKLEVALRQLAGFMGCQPNELDLDHTPALGLRPVENGQHVPHQHDPNHLEYLYRPKHLVKTNGRRGESDLSLDSNSDKARIAKAKRLEKKRVESSPELDKALKILLKQKPPAKKTPPSRWPKGRKFQSRNNLRRK
jgi:hypothetical protein